MNKRTKYSFVLLFLAFALQASAQMTLSEAIRVTLQENYAVRMSRNDVLVAENNAKPGQAGLLPTVSAQGTVNYGINNTRIQLQNSPEIIEVNGAQAITLNASANVNYTIFSGFANRRTLQQLELTADLSDTQSRLQVENTILQVGAAYYNVLRAELNVNALKETIEISQKRLTVAQNRFELSGGRRLAVLNAQVDMNKDSVNLMNAELALEEAKIAFNEALGRSLTEPVDLATEFDFAEFQAFEELKSKMDQQNTQMLIARQNEQLSTLGYKIAQSAYSPSLSFSGSYSYTKIDNEGSFLRLNESNGPAGVLTLSVPIFTGGTRKTAVQNADIRMRNSILQIQDTERKLESSLFSAYKDYRNGQQIMRMESANVETARANFEFTQEQFGLGQANSTQFREAQLNLLLTQNNLNNIRYNVKLAELELMRLTGALVEVQ